MNTMLLSLLVLCLSCISAHNIPFSVMRWDRPFPKTAVATWLSEGKSLQDLFKDASLSQNNEMVLYLWDRPEINPKDPACVKDIVELASLDKEILERILADRGFDPELRRRRLLDFFIWHHPIHDLGQFELLATHQTVDLDEQKEVALYSVITMNQEVLSNRNPKLIGEPIEEIQAEMFKMLLSDPRVDPSKGDSDLLVSACLSGNNGIVKLLLEHPKINPAVQNNEPLRIAVRSANTELVRLLLKDPRVNPVDALQLAVLSKNAGTVRTVLSCPRVDLNDYSDSPVIQLGYLVEMVKQARAGKLEGFPKYISPEDLDVLVGNCPVGSEAAIQVRECQINWIKLRHNFLLDCTRSVNYLNASEEERLKIKSIFWTRIDELEEDIKALSARPLAELALAVELLMAMPRDADPASQDMWKQIFGAHLLS